LQEKLGREPEPEEIGAGAGRAGVCHQPLADLVHEAHLARRAGGEQDGADYNEIIGDDRVRSPFNEINDQQLRAEMEELLERLDKRERDILKYRYGLQGVKEETLEDVGKRFKITRERMRQIQNAAWKSCAR
jgi:RNA polymerase primary sigma factor